ncbi:hypothetical protein [Oribacterium sp. FC2011]|uniref:hypothetical protein n=1 Tax=Oribacterium sp. FC2011 TaxID=1408311 RepID=UPI0004E0FE23|nr:hypothetical protein [Oribacterium sp. FC2011]
MKIKKAGLVLVTSALVSIGAMVSYAGATGIQGVDAYNTQSQTAGTTTDQTAGTTVDSSQAAALINGFATKLNASQNFGVNEKISMNMNMTYGVKSESTGTISERYSIINGDNAHITINVTEYENGVLTGTESSEQYYIKDGVNHKAYEVKNGAVTDSQVLQAMNLRENYFPIKYHGNETVTIENGEFVVRGYMLKEDYANSNTIGGEDVLSSLGLTDDVTKEMNDALTNMPYELHFNTSGDLTFMQIDMSGLINGTMSIFKAIYGEEAAGLEVNGQMIYQAAFNLDPSQTFAVPYYLN